MSEKWRDHFTFDYYDLSQDEAAWGFTMLHEDDEVEYRHAGFKPLGVARAVHRIDAQRKLTSQIWVSADGRVMADGDELATFFEDGSIVKTSLRPSSAFFNAARWRMRSHPKDRHPYTFVDGPLNARLEAHRAQVARFEKDSPVVVADSMTHHFAVRLRDAELRISRQRPEEIITAWVALTIAFASLVWFFLADVASHPEHRHPRASLFALLVLQGVLALFIVAIGVGAVMFTWIAPWLVRLRPGAPPRPAAAWIDRAREIPAGTLEDT